jgi:hypothetical protein
MWKADFDTVDEAISDGFEEDKRFVVLWVEDDLLDFALEMVLSMHPRHALDMHVYLESLDVVHLLGVYWWLRTDLLARTDNGVQMGEPSISTGYK